jgi:hypothetical protein
MTQAVAPGVNRRPSIHFVAAPYRDFPFPSSYRKRKRSSNCSSEDETEVSFFPQLPSSPIASSPDDSEGDHRNKRPRRTNIEYGMHGMTLQSHVSPISSSGASVAGSSVASGHQTYSDSGLHHTHNILEPELLEVDEAFMPRDVEFDSKVGTPQVEEVPSPTASKNSELGDVKMKGASWYEPEKDRELAYVTMRPKNLTPGSVGIIITDIDDYSSDEESTPPSEPHTYWDADDQCYKPFEISPAYLLHFGGVPKPATLQRDPRDSLALVAYRPPPIILPQRPDEVEEPTSNDQREAELAFQSQGYQQAFPENDAMDIDDM